MSVKTEHAEYQRLMEEAEQAKEKAKGREKEFT